MFGMRCEQCGEVRWSIFALPEEKESECPACGAQMTVERRHPRHQQQVLSAERRDRARFAPPVKPV